MNLCDSGRIKDFMLDDKARNVTLCSYYLYPVAGSQLYEAMQLGLHAYNGCGIIRLITPMYRDTRSDS